MRIGVIIQARLDSVRLPHKVLRQIGDRGTVLEHVVCAAKKSQELDYIAITTPDLALFYLARNTFEVYPQWWTSPRNPLAEYRVATSSLGLDTIVRLTADCPTLTGEILDEAIRAFQASRCDILYNGTDGVDVEVFTREALESAYRYATEPEDREHVTRWMKRNLIYRELPPLADKGYKSLDTAEDLAYIQAWFDKTHGKREREGR